MKTKYYLLNLLLLSSLTILLYYRVIFYDYVWDDLILFVYSNALSEQNLSWDLISRPVIEGSAYFRPFVFYSWFVEFNVFGQSTKISHIVNILIFSLNAWLTFLLATRFLKKYCIFLPSLALIFYVLNPILIESTVWISGRFDLFVTFFILLSLNIYFSEKINKNIKNILVSIFLLFALFSKELAIIFPFLLFFLWAYDNEIKLNKLSGYLLFFKENLFLILSFFVVFLIYFYFRYNALGVIGSTTYNHDSSIVFQDLVVFQAIFFYLKNFLLPVFYVLPIHPISWDLIFLDKVKFSVFIIAIVVVIAYLSIKNKKEIWLIFALISTIVLVLYIIPFNNGSSIGNMRFMTLGMSIYSIIFVKFLYDFFVYLKIKKDKKIAIIVVGSIYFLFLVLMVQNFNQSVKVWKNEYYLWKTSYLVNPDYSVNKYNYIKTLVDVGMLSEAKLILDKNNVNMSPDEQALYALILVNLNDEEGILYYQGLVDSLPKYHENYTDVKYINSMMVYANTKFTTQNLSALYSSYAMSILMFENDKEKAKKYFIISDWYYNSDLVTRSNHNDFIIDYIVYDKKDALSIFLDKTKNNFGSRGERLKVLNFINTYCNKYSSEELCKKWKIDKLKI